MVQVSDVPAWMATACRVTGWPVWGLFAVDVCVRVILAPQRRRYLLTNWLDVLAVALPMLRPLRVLRAVLALSILGRRWPALRAARPGAALMPRTLGCIQWSL